MQLACKYRYINLMNNADVKSLFVKIEEKAAD